MTLLIPVPVFGEEPEIPGRIVANVFGDVVSNTMKVEWEVGKKKRPVAGSYISVEDGNSQYFATVLHAKGRKIVTDYYPISTVPHSPVIRLVHR